MSLTGWPACVKEKLHKLSLDLTERNEHPVQTAANFMGAWVHARKYSISLYKHLHPGHEGCHAPHATPIATTATIYHLTQGTWETTLLDSLQTKHYDPSEERQV